MLMLYTEDTKLTLLLIKDEKEDNSDLNKALVEEPLPSSESVDVLIRSYANHPVCRTPSADSLSPGLF